MSLGFIIILIVRFEFSQGDVCVNLYKFQYKISELYIKYLKFSGYFAHKRANSKAGSFNFQLNLALIQLFPLKSLYHIKSSA